jgi:hypothetical protein
LYTISLNGEATAYSFQGIVMCVDGAGKSCREDDLVATGETRRTRSTRKGNAGGVSVQEGFLDREGRAVTRHTVYDRDGRIVHGPHFRPGGFT